MKHFKIIVLFFHKSEKRRTNQTIVISVVKKMIKKLFSMGVLKRWPEAMLGGHVLSADLVTSIDANERSEAWVWIHVVHK